MHFAATKIPSVSAFHVVSTNSVLGIGRVHVASIQYVKAYTKPTRRIMLKIHADLDGTDDLGTLGSRTTTANAEN